MSCPHCQTVVDNPRLGGPPCGQPQTTGPGTRLRWRACALRVRRLRTTRLLQEQDAPSVCHGATALVSCPFYLAVQRQFISELGAHPF